MAASLPITDADGITQQLLQMGFGIKHIQQALQTFKVNHTL